MFLSTARASRLTQPIPPNRYRPAPGKHLSLAHRAPATRIKPPNETAVSPRNDGERATHGA